MPGDPDSLKSACERLPPVGMNIEDQQVAIALCRFVGDELSWADGLVIAEREQATILSRDLGVLFISGEFQTQERFHLWRLRLNELKVAADKALEYHRRGFRFIPFPGKTTFSWSDSDARLLFFVLDQWERDIETADIIRPGAQRVLRCWQGQEDKLLKSMEIKKITRLATGTVDNYIADLRHHGLLSNPVRRLGFKPSVTGVAALRKLVQDRLPNLKVNGKR